MTEKSDHMSRLSSSNDVYDDRVAMCEDSASDDPATQSSKGEVRSPSTARTTPSSSFEAKTRSGSQSQSQVDADGFSGVVMLSASHHATLIPADAATPPPLHTHGGLNPDGIGTSTAYQAHRPEFEGTDQSWPRRTFPTHEPWYEEGPRAFLANPLFAEQRVRDKFPENTFRKHGANYSAAAASPNDAFRNNWYLRLDGQDVVQGMPPIKPELVARLAAVDF
jgi:hypothetical protein